MCMLNSEAYLEPCRRFILQINTIVDVGQGAVNTHLKLVHANKSYLLTLSLPVPCWGRANADLDSNSDIFKTARVNNVFTKICLKSIRQTFY